MFARRVKQPGDVEQKDPGWKLFGRVPPRDGPTKDPRNIQKVDARTLTGSCHSFASSRVVLEVQTFMLAGYTTDGNC